MTDKDSLNLRQSTLLFLNAREPNVAFFTGIVHVEYTPPR